MSAIHPYFETLGQIYNVAPSELAHPSNKKLSKPLGNNFIENQYLTSFSIAGSLLATNALIPLIAGLFPPLGSSVFLAAAISAFGSMTLSDVAMATLGKKTMVSQLWDKSDGNIFKFGAEYVYSLGGGALTSYWIGKASNGFIGIKNLLAQSQRFSSLSKLLDAGTGMSDKLLESFLRNSHIPGKQFLSELGQENCENLFDDGLNTLASYYGLEKYAGWSGNILAIFNGARIHPKITKTVKLLDTAKDLSEAPIDLETSLFKIRMQMSRGGPRARYTQSQDSAVVKTKEDGTLDVVVIDGIGGEGDGFKAAEHLGNFLQQGSHHNARHSLEEANADLIRANQNNPKHPGYACACILKTHKDGTVSIANLGDTNLLTIRDTLVLPSGSTGIHNQAYDTVNNQVDYFNAPNKNIVTRLLGKKYWETSNKIFKGQEGDIHILASDGVWDFISEYEIELLAKKYPKVNDLHDAIWQVAYARNNLYHNIRHNPFIKLPAKLPLNHIQVAEQEQAMFYPNGKESVFADNITLVVIQRKTKET